jgi:hypothetical protein
LVAPEEDQRRIQAASVTFVTDGISGNSCIARRHAAAPCMRRMHDRGDPVGHLQMVIPVAIGFPWFEADDYSALRDLFSDGDRLPPTFEAWHAGPSCRCGSSRTHFTSGAPSTPHVPITARAISS